MQALLDARWVFVSGGLLTLKIFIAASVVMMACSVLAGLARLSSARLVRIVAVSYIELFRGTSAVVQLFWLYFALPFFGISLGAYEAAVLGLGLCFGAYGAEIVRGAILAVPNGQYEAAQALSLSSYHRMRDIIFPQALAIMMPSLGNLLVLLLKATSIASLITLPELTFQAYTLNVRTFATIPIFCVVLAIYFLFASLITTATRLAERRITFWRPIGV